MAKRCAEDDVGTTPLVETCSYYTFQLSDDIFRLEQELLF